MTKDNLTVTFDFECNTVCKANPFTASGKAISYSIKVLDGETEFYYHEAIDFIAPLRRCLHEAKLIIAHNAKFDLHWASRLGVKPNPRARIWDTQIAEFIITGQKMAYPSLDACCEKYGLGQKDETISNYWKIGVDTEDIPRDELEVYGNRDVDLTYRLYQAQLAVMSEKQKKLCFLMGLDLLVLADMERNGVKFNFELCNEKEADVGEKLSVVTEELLTFAPDPRINLGSGQQLSCLLYGGAFEVTWVAREEPLIYKSGIKKGQPYIKNHYESKIFECPPIFKPLKKTENKLPYRVGDTSYPIWQTSEDVLKQLSATNKRQRRLIELLLLRAEYSKLMETYYGALPVLLETMEWGEYIHGQYNQVVAATGRLSSSKPNMQNFSNDVDQLLVSRYET